MSWLTSDRSAISEIEMKGNEEDDIPLLDGDIVTNQAMKEDQMKSNHDDNNTLIKKAIKSIEDGDLHALQTNLVKLPHFQNIRYVISF
jgi:hypothetical protein